MPANTNTLGVTNPNTVPLQPTGALSGVSTPPASTTTTAAPTASTAMAGTPSPLAAPTGALSSSSQIDPTTLTGALGTATTWTPSESDLASSRLTSMLSSDSPYLTRARSRAAQYANSRGLLNSSIAASAGEAAAIDAAAPIATADASTLARAGEFNAGAQNTITGQSNDFQIRGALARYDAQNTAEQNDLNRTSTAQQNELARIEDARQFDAGQALNREQTAAQLAAQQAQQNADRQVGVSDRVAALRQNALNQITQIEMSNLDTASKAYAMQRVWDQLDIAIQDAVQTSGVDMPETWDAYIDTMQPTVQGSATGQGTTTNPSPPPPPEDIGPLGG